MIKTDILTIIIYRIADWHESNEIQERLIWQHWYGIRESAANIPIARNQIDISNDDKAKLTPKFPAVMRDHIGQVLLNVRNSKIFVRYAWELCISP